MEHTSQRRPNGRPAFRSGVRLVVILAVLAMVAAACGSSTKKSNKPTGSTSTTASGGVPQGGTLTLGAEQEPDCADWIDACAGSAWGSWIMAYQTLPRSFDIKLDNGTWVYTPSNLLQGEPTLKTTPDEVVTYKINPKAVWSDGTPITSADFQYTWDQIAHGTNIYDTTGYADIKSVDTPDPQTAVVTYSTPYAGWKGLFGGQYGIFPSHILKGQDRDALMKDGYQWSGGPWEIQSWQKGTSVTLVPNPKYWGDKPHLDKVVFKFIEDTAAEFSAVKTGEVSAIYPQPQSDVVDAIKSGLSGLKSSFSTLTGSNEALYFNNAKAPLDDVKVRQAVSYSIDRVAVVKSLFGALGVKQPMQTLNPPILASFGDATAFSNYKLDLPKVTSLMTGDGYAKDSSGIWAKNGQEVNLELKTTAGNNRRLLTAQIVQSQLQTAGFKLTINAQKAGDLFGTQLPAGDFQIGLYAQVNTSLDPSLSSLFASKNIPTAANQQTGQNWQRVNIPAVDPLLEKVDTDFNQADRMAAQKQADKILAANAVALPIDPLPNILIWSPNVVGPVTDNPIFGMFWNMNEWGLKK